MNSELFVIDLSGCNNTGEIITNVSTAFEVADSKDRKIGLKLSDIMLNQSQMLSIQSLIASYGCELEFIETANESTRNTAENMGIKTQTPPYSEKPLPSNEEIAFEIGPKDMGGNNTALDTDSNGNNIPFDMGGNGNTTDLSQINETFANEFNSDNVEAQEFKGNGLPIDTNGNNQAFDTSGNNISDYQGNGFETFESITIEENFDDEADKQVMDTYKKACEEEDEEQTWEEVDYYAPPTDEPVVVDSKQTIYVNQTLRSGQVLEFDGNIVIIGDCHPGSEIKATGDITVWGVLGSIAHAGMKGNRDAKIRALKMNAVQLRIANCYSRRPDGTNIPYIIKSSVFTPEEARIVDDSIVLFKIN